MRHRTPPGRKLRHWISAVSRSNFMSSPAWWTRGLRHTRETLTLLDGVKYVLRWYTDDIVGRARREMEGTGWRNDAEARERWAALIARLTRDARRGVGTRDRDHWRRWYKTNKLYQRRLAALRRAGFNVRQFPTTLSARMVP